MKATFCAYDRPNYVGGPNAGLIRLLPELKRRGLDVECLLLVFGDRHELPTLRALEAAGVPCRYTRYHDNTELRVRWLLEQMRENPPDVFVPNLMPAAYFASRWCREAGIPTVGVLRNVDDFHQGFLEAFASGDLRFRQTTFVGVARLCMDMIRHEAPYMEFCEQIPSPVLVPEQTVAHGANPFRVMYSGRLVLKSKRADLIAEAFCKSAREVEGTAYSILGHGPDRDKVEAVLEREGQGLDVTLVGRVDSTQMPEQILRHQCVVLFSEYEGVPLAFTEAMAAGVVPLATRGRGGVEELVEHERTGLYLDDPLRDLPKAVARLKNDPALYAELSANARKRASELAGLDKVADQWCALFARLQGTEGPRRRIADPLFLDLPPVNPKVAVEDQRVGRLGRVAAWAKSRTTKFRHGDLAQFTHPRLHPSNLDTWLVRRSILRALREALPSFQGLVADIGAGRAPYRRLALSAPKVTGHVAVDLPDTAYARPDLAWDGETLPLKENSVGTVLASEVLEHCPDPVRFLAEACRVLEPGGACFLTVPFLWPLHDVPHDAFRYTPWSLERLLKDAGFGTLEIKALGGYDAAMAQMVGLYLRRRSRSKFYTRLMRPLLSLAGLPLTALLAGLDKRPEQFREGLMVTGLSVLAFKPDSKEGGA